MLASELIAFSSSGVVYSDFNMCPEAHFLLLGSLSPKREKHKPPNSPR